MTLIPFVIEKNGRERRLDDGLTAVQPVWSPDSAKVACAFEHQVRVYDSRGDTPTQAAIPMRNNLLISSQAYDREQQAKLDADPAVRRVRTGPLPGAPGAGVLWPLRPEQEAVPCATDG